jgi:hypothetical protein
MAGGGFFIGLAGRIGYAPDVRSTRRLLALCTLACGLWAACSHNSGPATSAYLRECSTLAAGITDQARALPAVAMPAHPALPQSPTDDQQRVYDGLVRIYPLYVNQYHAAVMKRLQAITELYNQALDRIGSLDAAGVDAQGVQLMTLHVQLLTEERDFYAELRSVADHNQTSLVRRKSVDEADERLLAVFNAAMGEISAAPGAVGSGLRDIAAAFSKRGAEPFGVGDQAAKLADRAGQLQRDMAGYQTESAKFAASLETKYPGQDWGGYGPKPGAPGK